MKNSRRNFLIVSLLLIPAILLDRLNITNDLLIKKIKVYKKKYSKIWLLDINDS